MSRYPGFNTYMEFDRGFHGWLVFFFGTSSLAVFVRAYAVFRTAGELRVAIDSRHVLGSLTITAFLLIRAGFFVANIVGLVMFAKGDSRTPTFWATLLLATIIASASIIAVLAFESSLLYGDGFVGAFLSRVGPIEIGGAIGAVLWVLYWMRSKRVRLTFGRNAFSAAHASQIESVVPVT